MTDHCVYLALGSNMGDRHAIMNHAIDEIGRLIGVVERRSVFLETEPWGFDSPNRFLNACVRCRTTLTPHTANRRQHKPIASAGGDCRFSAEGRRARVYHYGDDHNRESGA